MGYTRSTPDTARTMQHHTQTSELDYATGIEAILTQLDTQKGLYMSSGIEYPGRYSRWDFALIDPPVEFIAYATHIDIKSLNPRGEIILKMLRPLFEADSRLALSSITTQHAVLHVLPSDETFAEEHRSHKPSVVTPLRVVMASLKTAENDFGFYGAFGFDLIGVFEALEGAPVNEEVKLYHLYFTDEVYLVDRRKETALRKRLVLEQGGVSTASKFIEMDPRVLGLKPGNENDSRGGFPEDDARGHCSKPAGKITTNISDAEYEAIVRKAQADMALGDIFELVPSRRLTTGYAMPGSSLFADMRTINPSPYEFYLQMGEESLVGTSPEMFVRVKNGAIESCPISGTIRRGAGAMEDEQAIRALLNSAKDEVELTMCTDVDRNDKSRICKAGSIELLARRSIEKYAGLFHTVDHVRGELRDEFDGLDGFLSHMWAVTLTGAPKKNAVERIYKVEPDSRRWYGGAVGMLAFCGDVNTAITIRTVHLKEDQAHYQVGASLVCDSDPADEVAETHTKATTFYKVMGVQAEVQSQDAALKQVGKGLKAVMIDHQDSFVHTLAEYFRRLGVEVETYRAPISAEAVLAKKPDFVLLSPGPGLPKDLGLPTLIQGLAEKGMPMFGVCLGLQGMVEAFGGSLKQLKVPHQGKQWTLQHKGENFLKGIAPEANVAAYHAWVADIVPPCFNVIARNEQGDVMAIAHQDKPIFGVQFHPESILTLENGAGLSMIAGVIKGMIGSSH
jgi:anthranilate synthase